MLSSECYPLIYCQLNPYLSIKVHIIVSLFWISLWLPAFLTTHYYLLHLFSCHILYKLQLKSSQLSDLELFVAMSVSLARIEVVFPLNVEMSGTCIMSGAYTVCTITVELN